MNLHVLRSQESEKVFYFFLMSFVLCDGCWRRKYKRDYSGCWTRLGQRCGFSGSCVISGPMEGSLMGDVLAYLQIF